MASRNTFSKWMKEREKEAKKQRRAREKARNEAFKAAEKAEKEYARMQAQLARATEQERKAHEKEQKRLYTEMRVTKAESMNEEIESVIAQLNRILLNTLNFDDFFDLNKLKRPLHVPEFDPANFGGGPRIKPIWEGYAPPEPKGLQKMVPGAKQKYEKEVAAAKRVYQSVLKTYESSRAKYEQSVQRLKKEVDEHNAKVEEFKQEFSLGSPKAVIDYFALVLEASIYPDDFPQHAKLAYVPESKQLVIEYDLPTYEVIPTAAAYKYNKTRDEITETARPATQRKALYSSLISQIALRTLHELFEADRTQHLETIVFNGYVESLDRGVGHTVRTCVITVRTDRDTFLKINLEKVDPATCLKTLNASVSKSPDELAPVRPVLEFSMVDPRFIEETDVLSSLDQRPNLMELSPSEFESLITNLFTKMGLEARLTQASRDGGVDCVAYDPRPIFGGKVVIQAKRYKHTVGVSAVRDLFGTVQNEGASKGILVTTSGYGKAAFQFAEGKPLELLSGSNLLYLLEEHAAIKAKIETPSDWKEPHHDIEIED